MLQIVGTASAAEPVGLTAGMVNPGHQDKPDWFKLSFLDIREDIAEAAAANKRVLLYFYQDGCPYCKKLLQDNFGQKAIADKTQKHFDVIAVNMWGDREVTDLNGIETTEKQFALQMRVMFTPTLLFLDEKGAVALRVNGYYYPGKFETALDYVSGKKETSMSFADFYKNNTPEKATGKLHTEVTNLPSPWNLTDRARKSKRPLMVMFEQKVCKACDELHLDVLKKEQVQKEMARFDIVVLDMHSPETVVTPEGKTRKVSQWAHDLDIKYAPSMVFFDAQGKEVFRAEAYLRTFHVAGSMSYVSSGAYLKQPSFQRYLQAVTKRMHDQGIEVNLLD